MLPANAAKLLRWVEEVVKTFNPVVSSVDTHAKDVLGDTESEDADPDRVFVKQVFYGCVRYKKVLKVFLASFYHVNGSSVSRSQYVRLMALAYVVFFRLEDVGFDTFRALAMGLDPTTMHIFVSYCFNQELLDRWVKDEWIKHLDLSYVEDVIFAMLDRHREEAKQLLDELQVRAFGLKEEAARAAAEAAEAAKPVKIPPTVPQPFNLTAPRPRRVPEPERIPQVAMANPMPEHLDDVTLEDLKREEEARREQARLQTLEKYATAPEQPFKLHETRANLPEVRAAVEEERNRECTFGAGFRANPVPTPPRRKAAVRLNTAAVLREDALYRRKQEEEARMIAAFEAELRDASEFHRWRSAEQRKEEEAGRRALELRRVELAAAAKEAAEASERARMEKQRAAAGMKAEAAAQEMARRELFEEEVAIRREQAESIREVREVAPREAEKRILEERRRRRDALREEMEERRQRREKEMEEERLAREDLIRQIRALERVPVVRAKRFDPTETSGVGLLEEMSLVELRERLELVKKRNEEEERARRERIVSDKAEMQQRLQRKMKRLEGIRESASKRNRETRARRKAAEAEAERRAQREREEAMLQMAEQLERKREARRREQEELRAAEAAIAKKRMFLGAEKSQVEKKHFEQLLAGAERQARDRQRVAKQEALALESVKERAERERMSRVRREQRSDKEKTAAARRRVESARKVEAEKEFKEQQEKKARYRETKAREQEALSRLGERNRYATEQTRRLRELARTRTQTLQRAARHSLANTSAERVEDALGRTGASAQRGEDGWSGGVGTGTALELGLGTQEFSGDTVGRGATLVPANRRKVSFA